MNRQVGMLCLCVVLLCCACGGHPGAQAPAGGGTAIAQPQHPLAGNLPALDLLPMPARRASLSGPGWYAIELADMAGASGAVLNGASIELQGAAPLSYVLYGVWGFDGDNGPTSLRVSAGSVAGAYYVAFSDYKNGNWAFAGPFTGSAETSGPEMDQHATVNDFVSRHGVCYVALVIAPSATLLLDKLELGVHGGIRGPRPPQQLSAIVQDGMARLDWVHALDANSPDFNGYLVERAPALTGEFEPRHTTPLRTDYFLDSAPAGAETWRYRVCSVDASGNRSPWIEALSAPPPDFMLGVVAQLSAPHGPLFGPATVNFDLSGSQALEGQPFTRYEIAIAHGPVYESFDNPVLPVTLQPGCYTITGTVEGSIPDLTSVDSTTRTLLVLPRWRQAPVVVRGAAQPSGLALARLERMRGCLLTGGDAVLLGYDPTMAGLGLWRGQPGAPPQLARLPGAPVAASGEPAQLGQQAYFPLAASDSLYLLRVGSGQPEVTLELARQPYNAAVASAVHNTEAWLLHSSYDAALSRWSLNWAAVSGGRGLILDDTGGEVRALDAVYVPGAAAIDVVYSDQDSTDWLRWDPVALSVVASATLSGAGAEALDLELHPATGRPVLAYSISYVHYYRELDDLEAWGPEQAIDSSVVNFTPLDLAVDEGVLYACFATWPEGTTRRYKYDAGAWSNVNTVSFSGDDGYQVALLPLPGDPGSLVADVDNAGTVFLAKLTEGAPDEVLWQIGATDGQGFELHAAAGTDGLHAVWRCERENRVRHYLSADGGASWSDADPGLGLALGVRDLDLSATTEGNIYLSLQDGMYSYLLAWDAGAQGFSLRKSFYNSGEHRPYLSHSSSGTMWHAYEGEASTMHYYAGAAVDTPVVLATTPVWDGVVNNSFDQPGWVRFPALVVQGQIGAGSLPRLGLLGFGAADSTFITAVADPELLLGPAVRGRTLATTTYSSGLPGGGMRTAYFATYGAAADALRYELAPGADPQLSALGMAAGGGTDARRTVSAALAQGLTGVVLLSSLDGSLQLCQWSNFGQWQELPRPPGLQRAFSPELIVGEDGRWHILYKDWRSDELLCWSTL